MQSETILKLARATGTDYCHHAYCNCGGDADGTYPNLLFTNTGGGKPIPNWLPHWANGCIPEELYAWVQQEAWTNPVIAQALVDQGIKRYHRYKPHS